MGNNHQESEMAHKITISQLERMVNGSIDNGLKEADKLLKEMEVSIDTKFAKLVDKVCKDAYYNDEPPTDLALWYRAGYKYLEKYDVANQALWKEYDVKDTLHKKNMGEFNQIKKPSKLNLLGRYLYYKKEKSLKFEASSVEAAYKKFCVSDEKFEERFNNLNEIDNKEAYELHSHIENAMFGYLKTISELGTLKSIKAKIEQNENKQVNLEGLGRNKNDVIKNADFFEKQLDLLSKNKTIVAVDAVKTLFELSPKEKLQVQMATKNQAKSMEMKM